MKTNIINTKSILPNSFRFDPSFHLSEAIILGKDLDNVPYEKISIKDTNSKVFLGNIFSRIFVKDKEHGIPYLAASDTVLADINTGRFLSKKQSKELAYLMLKKDWIVITCSGTIGNVTYTNSTFENHIATHDLIRIVPNDEKILKGYLYAFLSSKYGYNQLTQSRFGGVVKHINADHVNGITLPLFPEPFQKEVDDLIQESARLREEATDALDQAISYFNDKYTIKEDTQKTFTLSLKELKLGFAAYNNNLEVDQFIDEYKSDSYELSEKTKRIFAPPLFKHIYLNKDNGYPFMTGSELTQFNLRYYRWLSPKGVKDINDYIVKKGTLLLYKSGTTDGGILGNVFIADNKLNGCCLSDHVIRIVFNDVKEAYWAFAFLRSKGATRMLKRLATGTMIPFITPERISRLRIPNPDDNFDAIVSLVEKYINLNSTSKENETKAIIMVEQEIEKWNKN